MPIHFETIDENTKTLLYQLLSLQSLAGHYLVGGTALALQIGHRKSIDLDFFGKAPLDYDDIIQQCVNFGTVEAPQQHLSSLDSSTKLIQFNLNGVKIDILRYQELLLKPIVQIEGLRLASLEDIAAMKIRAIEDRTTKKDFFDLYALLDFFSLQEILNFAQQKYNSKSPVFALECILDIDQADVEIDPISLLELDWQKVKSRIIQEAKGILL